MEEDDKKPHKYAREEAYTILAQLIENEKMGKRNFEDNEDRIRQLEMSLNLFDRARMYSLLAVLNDSIEDAQKSWDLYLLADTNRFGVHARKQQRILAYLCFDALHYHEVKAIVKTCIIRKQQKT